MCPCQSSRVFVLGSFCSRIVCAQRALIADFGLVETLCYLFGVPQDFDREVLLPEISCVVRMRPCIFFISLRRGHILNSLCCA